jgi:hypothetical protein
LGLLSVEREGNARRNAIKSGLMSKRAFVAVCCAMLVAACNAYVPSIPFAPIADPSSVVDAPNALSTSTHAIQTPALVVVTPNGIVKYYPVTPDGRRDPIAVTRVSAVRRFRIVRRT